MNKMPKRGRGNLTNRTRNADYCRNRRNVRTPSQHEQDNEDAANRMEQMRLNESEEQRNARRAQNVSRILLARQQRTNAFREQNLQHQHVRRAYIQDSFLRAAFNYEPDIEYSAHQKVIIGQMDKECQHCRALKFKNEAPGICCASGKICLPALNTPPEPLKTLLTGVNDDGKFFLKNLRKINSCFQMTSFAAGNVVQHPPINGRRFESTFRIQGQVYHRIGSLIPMPNEVAKFLQIYFMGGSDDDRVETRCTHNNLDSPQGKRIVHLLETFFQQHNHLIRLFKTVMPRLTSDNHAIVIRPDKTPTGQHARTFNAPTVNDVAVIIAGDPYANRDIKIQRRDNQIMNISDTHRSYDALQYPLIFFEGDDGYCINLKQRNPATGNTFPFNSEIEYLSTFRDLFFQKVPIRTKISVLWVIIHIE